MYKYIVSLNAGFGVISKDLNVLAKNKYEALVQRSPFVNVNTGLRFSMILRK